MTDTTAPTDTRRRTIGVLAASVALTAGIFVLDMQTPPGLIYWLLYLLPVLISSWGHRSAWPLTFAGLCTVLIGLGLYLSPIGIPFTLAWIDRLVGVALLWAFAIAVSTSSSGKQASEPLAFGLSRQTVANLMSICLIVILLQSMTYLNTMASQESMRLIAHTHKVLTELSLTRSSLTDAESSHRTFLRTGEDRYLEPYRQEVTKLPGHLEHLKGLIQDDPLQKSRFSALDAGVEEKLGELREIIAVHRNQGQDAARRIVESDLGKASMDTLRRKVGEMEDAEQDLQVQRLQQLAILSQSQTLLLLLGGLVFMGLTARTILLLRQEQIAQREQAIVIRQILSTLDTTVDGAFVFDPRTLRFSYVNKGAVQQVRYSREELLRMTPLDLKPEFDEPRFRAMIAPLVSGAESIRSFTTVHRRKDSVDIPVEINLQCVEAGTAQARLIAIVRDITERKQLEANFIRVVDGAPHAMILVNQKGAMTLVNAQTERLFGYSRGELLGQSIDILVPACFRGAHPGHRAAFFADPKARSIGVGRDLNGLHKDGREIPVEIGLSPIETKEGLMVLSSIMDISERKRAEAEIRKHSWLLEAANKELEAFAYSVSHDLRAPLRSIDGFSQALLEDCAGLLNEQGKDHLSRIRAASQRMGQLIDDLLSLSRATRDKLWIESVDLSALALGSADEARKIWPGRQVELVVAPGLRTSGDPRLLRIVFDNLLGNAWKFTSKQERAAIEVGTMSYNGRTAYFVRDNGAGFDMAYVDKLFAPFQRLHAITEYPGTGIGLATVQRIIYRHGGLVWAEGKMGEGATFYFTLAE